MDDTPQRLLQLLAALFTETPGPVSALIVLALLGATLWAARAAWKSFRILRALATAPLADLRSNATGLVKLVGTAQPPPPAPGFSASETVWHRSRRQDGSRSTTSSTVGHFLLEDEHGVCAIDSAEAVVVATVSETKHAFMNSNRWVSDESIRRGDRLIALGELRRDLPPPAGMEGVRCQLKRAGGVLLVSGSPERQVKVLYGLWLGVQFPVVLLGTCIVALGVLFNLASRGGGDDHLASKAVAWLLSTEHLEPASDAALGKLLEVGPPFGLQLTAPPVGDYAAAGWGRVEVAGVSMAAPPGWVVAERDDASAFPSVGLVAPENDAWLELRVIPDVLRRPGIALEEALDNYASAKERGARGVVLGYAPLLVDGAIGHVEIMNSGGAVTEPDGSLSPRTNSYRGSKRLGEAVIKVELTGRFAQANQDRFGPLVLNAVRSMRIGAP